MKIRALARVAILGLLFILLFSGAHASSMRLESQAVAASTPAWSNFQPSDWVIGPQVSCSVAVDNQDGLIALGSYRLSTNGGSTWSSELTEGLSISLVGGGTSGTLTVADLSFSHSSTADQNQVKFSIRDGLGLQWWSGAYSVGVDRLPPTSAVNTGGCYRTDWPGAITGTASDSGSGVAQVEIALQRSSGWYYNGSGWQPTEAWLYAVGTDTWSYALAPEEDSYAVRSRAIDQVGHVQTGYGQSTFLYDVTLPQSAVETAGYFNEDTWPGLVVGTAGDATSGVASVQITLLRSDGLYYDGSGWVAEATWLSTSGTSAWSLVFAPSLDAQYTVRSRAADNCGNVQASHGTNSFVYDATAPGPPADLAVSPIDWTSSNAFNVTWNNPTDVSGIGQVRYKWNSAPSSNGDDSPGSPVERAGIDSISGLMVPAEGAHRLYLWLEDVAGNASFANYAATEAEAFKWDGTPPVTTIDNLVGVPGCTGWYTSEVQVEFTATDSTSGVTGTFWRQDGGGWELALGSTFTVTGEGQHIVEYYSVDAVGNDEAPQELIPQIKIDGTPPSSNQPSYTGTQGNDDWYVSPVHVVLTSFDATSGVSAVYHQVNDGAFEVGDQFDLTADGPYTVSYYSVDVACNEEEVQTAAESVRIDSTPPSTAVQIDGISQDGWFITSPVTVTLTSSEVIDSVPTSGVEHIRYRIGGGSWQQWSSDAVTFTVSLPPGQLEAAYVVQYYATDSAGNEAATQALTIAIDQQAPGQILVVPIVSPPNWTKTNCVTITWDASANPADLSGVGGAYYSFSSPTSPTDGALVDGDNITAIPCVQVPDGLGDGAHNVYVWLRDKAGNSNHETKCVVTVRLDRTPPQITYAVDGDLCGDSGWYNSCVSVSFNAQDVHSGMATGVISYEVNGGGWVPGSLYAECGDGVYSINGRAMDSAGNTSAVVAVPVVKLDRTPPNAPIDLQVSPSDWSSESSFTVTWLNPSEQSGLAGAFYKQGSPPTSPMDGTYVDGVRSSLTVTASAEGAFPVHVWLKDKACNHDFHKRAAATLRYDGTPPTTTFSVVGTLGGDGWYTSAVQVTLQAADLASGWASSRYRVGENTWQSGAVFPIDAEGTTTFSFYSIDVAGNIEAPKSSSVKVDREPPTSFAYADGYSPTSSFTVRWTGTDQLSGIAAFDVQYRVGATGLWQDWVLGVDPSQTSKLFTAATAGKVYYFRSRATDRAGNAETYPLLPDVYVSVDVVQNGDFERALGSEWQRSWSPGEAGQPRQCLSSRGIVPAQGGGNTYAAVLGCPDESGMEEGQVPYGTSMLCQSLNVPGAEEMPAPVLSFQYHVFTYDVLWSERYQRFYDSFHLNVGSTPVLTDGNTSEIYGTLVDLGWREGLLDLRSYAGQTIDICFANVTRIDTLFNTWTFVDDVRMLNLEYSVHVPIIQRKANASGLSAGMRPRPARPAGNGPR